MFGYGITHSIHEWKWECINNCRVLESPIVDAYSQLPILFGHYYYRAHLSYLFNWSDKPNMKQFINFFLYPCVIIWIEPVPPLPDKYNMWN